MFLLRVHVWTNAVYTALLDEEEEILILENEMCLGSIHFSAMFVHELAKLNTCDPEQHYSKRDETIL